MKKTFKSVICLILAFSLIIGFASFGVSAAGTSIGFSKNTITKGDSLTVTININAGEAMYGVSGVVNYDSSILEYKSGQATGGAGSLRITESPSGETSVSYSLTFSAIASGSASVSFTDCIYATIGEAGSVEKPLSNSSAAVSVKDVTLSSNAKLRSLRVAQGTLSPAFSPDKYNYTVNVKNSVVECAVYATAADGGAKINISGSKSLALGKNTRKVTVTAPDGVTQKVYTIDIIRSEVADETEEETKDALLTQIDGADYSVIADLAEVRLFKGFQIVESTFNEAPIQVAQDVNKFYTVYYLKAADGEQVIPYTYNDVDKVFTKVAYLTQGENDFIFAENPLDIAVPEYLYETNLAISSFDIKAYADSREGMTEFYYVYCYFDGEYSFYRYDSKQGIIQRFPEIALSLVSSTANDEEDVKGMNAIDKFNSLTNNAKIIIISFVLLILLIVALLVLVIFNSIKKRNNMNFDEGYLNDLDFDSVALDDSYMIKDDTSDFEDDLGDDDELNSDEEDDDDID